MFSPHPRGWMNSAMKDKSVRDFTNSETKLFDDISEMSVRIELPLAATALADSIIELRDLHFFLTETVKMPLTDSSMTYALDGYNHYLKRMHSTDSDSLNKKMKQLFYEGVPFRDILRILCLCIESMCKINVAMIQMSLRSVGEAARKSIKIQ